MSDQPVKPKRQKKRFTSREQIIERIDKFTAKKSSKEDEIHKLLNESRELLESSRKKGGDEYLLRQNNRVENQIAKRGRSVIRYDRKLSALRNALGEFQTEIIPGVIEDRSIPGI